MAKRQNINVTAHGQNQIRKLNARPDFAISVGGKVVGHIELKAPGKGVDPSKWPVSSRDREQWDKIKVLPNLLYKRTATSGHFIVVAFRSDPLASSKVISNTAQKLLHLQMIGSSR